MASRFNYNMVSNQFYTYTFSQPQGASIDFPAFSFTIPTLLNFLVLKYQNHEKSPFETHPKTIILAISTLLLYCLFNDYQQRLRASSPMITRAVHHCTMFLGYMAVACLASLLFPDAASPVLYLLHITVSVADLLCFFYQKMKTMLWLRGGGNRIQGAPGNGNLLPV